MESSLLDCHQYLVVKKNLCNYFMKMKATVLLIFFVESIIAINVKELKELRLKLFEKINKQIELESISNRNRVYNFTIESIKVLNSLYLNILQNKDYG